MGIKASPEVKFSLIREASMRSDNLLNISKMCEIAGVSRSGYYNWCATENVRQAHEKADQKDFEIILEAYKYRGYERGVEGIHMRLLHKGIIMNVKKIRRLMRKYGLFCPIRKPNPYRQIMPHFLIAVSSEGINHNLRAELSFLIIFKFLKVGLCQSVT